MKSFEKWLKDRKTCINEDLTPHLLSLYKLYGEECYHRLIALETEHEELTEKARQLTDENAAFREGLEKAMGLPCKYADTVWIIGDTLFDLIDNPKCEHKIFEGIVAAIIVCLEIKVQIVSKSADFENVVWVNIEDYNKTWFTDRAAAEKRLAKLQKEQK